MAQRLNLSGVIFHWRNTESLGNAFKHHESANTEDRSDR
jgi:hypothetical protein